MNRDASASVPSPRGSSPDARGTDDVILDAALNAVLQHGIRRTSAADVARRSGLARQTIYRYWPDMTSLFASLVTRELLSVVPRASAADATLDALVDDLVATAAAVRDLPIIGRLRDTDPELFSRYILERRGSSQQAVLALLDERFAAAQHTGIVRAGDPTRLSAVVLLVLQSAIQSAPLVEDRLPDTAWREELAIALHGYLAPRGSGA